MKITLITLPSTNIEESILSFNKNNCDIYNDDSHKNNKFNKTESIITDELKNMNQVYKCLLAINGFTANEDSFKYIQKGIKNIRIVLFHNLFISDNDESYKKIDMTQYSEFKKIVEDRITGFINYYWRENVKVEIVHYHSEINKIVFDNAFVKIQKIVNKYLKDSKVYLDTMSGSPEIKKVFYPLGILLPNCECIEIDKLINKNTAPSKLTIFKKNYEYLYLKNTSLTNQDKIDFTQELLNLNKHINLNNDSIDNINFLNRTKYSNITKDHFTFEKECKFKFCINNYQYNFLFNLGYIENDFLRKHINTVRNAYSHIVNVVNSDEIVNSKEIPFLNLSILTLSGKYHLAFGEIENVFSTFLYTKLESKEKYNSKYMIQQLYKHFSEKFYEKHDYNIIKIRKKFIKKMEKNKFISVSELDNDTIDDSIILIYSYFILSLVNVFKEIKSNNLIKGDCELHNNTFNNMIIDDLKVNGIILDKMFDAIDYILKPNNKILINELLDKNCRLIYNILLLKKVRNTFIHSESNDKLICDILKDEDQEILEEYIKNINYCKKYLPSHIIISDSNKKEDYLASDLLKDFIEIYFKYYNNIHYYNKILKQHINDLINVENHLKMNDNNKKTQKNVLIAFFTNKCPDFAGIYGATFEMVRKLLEDKINLYKIILLVTPENKNIYDEVRITNELNKLSGLYFDPFEEINVEKVDFIVEKYNIDNCFKELYNIYQSKLKTYDTIYLDTSSGMSEMQVSISMLRFIDSKCKGLICSDDVNFYINNSNTSYTANKSVNATSFNNIHSINRPKPFAKIVDSKSSIEFVNLYDSIRKAIEKYDIPYLKQATNDLFPDLKSSVDDLFDWYNYRFETLIYINNNSILDKEEISLRRFICCINNLLLLKQNTIDFYLQIGVVIEMIVRFEIYAHKELFLYAKDSESFENVKLVGKNKWKEDLRLLLNNNKTILLDSINEVDTLVEMYDNRNKFIHRFTSKYNKENVYKIEVLDTYIMMLEKIATNLSNYLKKTNNYFQVVKSITNNKIKIISSIFNIK